MLNTPYYLINEKKIISNLQKIEKLKSISGAKFLLALKCFAAWSVFDIMKDVLDGTTSSSLFEARLGYEKFGGETHAFCVGYTDDDISRIKDVSDKIIFNSESQLNRFYPLIKDKNLGLRVNPGVSYSHYDLADPTRRYSRLGVADIDRIASVKDKISGLMFHFNCENDDFDSLRIMINDIRKRYGKVIDGLKWISLGGGIAYTSDGYPIEDFGYLLKSFSNEFDIQIYLEPGEAVITGSTDLVTTVVDRIYNEKDILIVDASVEPHALDLLIYRTGARFENVPGGRFFYQVAGRSCLAGDVFGEFTTDRAIDVGVQLSIPDSGGYTMVKKNWFNGLQMPSIAVERVNGTVEVVRSFDYKDFINSLS